MRRQRWNRFVQAVMAAALVLTGFPLIRSVWPQAAPAPAAGAGVLPGEIVVDARDDLTPAQLQSLNARYGLSLRLNSPEAREEQLLTSPVPAGQEAALAAQLDRDPLVEDAEPMRTYALPPEASRATRHFGGVRSGGSSAAPNDPDYPKQWNFKLVDAEKAWKRGATGKGIVVAVIDTGVAFEKDDKCYLAEDFGGTKFTRGFDFVGNDEHPNDDHGHGTHVAGTVAETTNNEIGVAGLAHEATIMPLKVLDSFGTGRSSDIADAIRFAADNGARIINMSLGSPFPDPIMGSACKYAAKKGVLIVCAAGNSSGGPVGYPAAFKECLAVSAVGPGGKLAFYSSVGKEVAIAAPGGDKSVRPEDGVLQNTVLYDGGEREDGYFYFQGTSMASPHVAAVAALAMGRGVTEPAEVRQLLQRGATPKGPAEKYGAGILSASRTVELADAAKRDSFLKLVFTLIAGFFGIGVGVIRSQVGRLTRFPFMPLGFALGFLGPDMIFGWLGFGAPFNIILHSALVPLYLLWEADSGRVYRFVSAMAFGLALHLAWDAFVGHVPLGGILPQHGIPWLWVNAIVGVGVALVAWRRSWAGMDGAA